MAKEICPYHGNEKWCDMSKFIANISNITGESDNKIYDLWLRTKE